MNLPGILLLVACALAARAENWPGWRGPRGDGASAERRLPLTWSATENIAWKTALPGSGHASPIVWGDSVFTVSAVEESLDRVLIRLDKTSGAIKWTKTVLKSDFENKHALNSHASSTPATDGNLVYTSFLDRSVMVVSAHDFEGNLKWQVRPGSFASKHGFCSSPVIYKDKLIVNGDHDGDSYIVALDRKDGHTLWKIPRKNKTRSCCVPMILEAGGRVQMILSGDKSVASYDPENGAERWYLNGPTEQFVASIVYNPKADLLFVTGGFPEFHLLGLKQDGNGLLDDSAIVWRSNRGVSYVPSPISFGDYFLITSDGGIGSCLDAKSGRVHWQERLGGDHHASLVSGAGHVYFLSDQGVTTVVKPGPAFDVVAKNELGERCFASPAISGGQIFLRGEKHLFAIGSKAFTVDQ